MKQTAVEWFFNELERMEYFIGNDIYQSYKEAKEMEKQQIENAFEDGDNNGADRIYYHGNADDKSAEQYYIDTFKKD
jgi:hypothetical protein